MAVVMHSSGCNFCLADDAQYLYPVDHLLTALQPASGQAVEYPFLTWRACDDCASLIDSDQYEQLAHRATAEWVRGTESDVDCAVTDELRAHYSTLYADFAEARGPRQLPATGEN